MELGSATGWAVDLAAGTISCQFERHTATAPVQLIGSHNDERHQWTWAWAIPSVPAHVCTDAESVREVGIASDHAALVSPTVQVDASGAADLMALAFRLTRATGFYRGPGTDSTYFTFGDVVLDRADGTSETFRISAT